MEKYRASVRTILSRIESHPDEFREHFGKWEDIQNAVADRVGGERNRLRGLTDEEAEAIFNKLKEHVWGPQFDEHVMTKVLDPQKEERELDAYKISLGKSGGGKINPYGWNDPRLLQAIKPGEIQGGGVYSIEVEQKARQLGLAPLLKKTLNKLKL